jgi:small-conductance mechanosensitive channel
LGYSSPKTLEAWIILAAALVLLVFSLLALSLLGLKLKSQGSRWAAHMPWTTPRAMNDLELRIFKIAIAANIVMVAGFLGFLALARGTSLGTESTVAAVIIFNVLIFSVNLSLCLYYRKQATKRRV